MNASKVATAASVAAILSITGCGSRDPGPDASRPTRSATAVVRDDLEDTCTRFVISALSVDSTTDRGPADARRRAARDYGSPDLVTSLQGEGRDSDWALLVAHRARVHVTTEPVADDPPPVRTDAGAAGVHATRIAVGVDWRQRLTDTIVYCSLRHGPDGWRVTRISVSDTIGREP